MIKNNLLNTSALIQPMYAPPEFNFGGGTIAESADDFGQDGYTDDQDPGNDDTQNPSTDTTQNNGQGEITGDTGDELAKFWEGFGEDNSELSDEDLAKQIADSEKQMGTELVDGIKNFTLPADLMPDDFDPTDRTQMQTFMQRSSQLAIQQAIQLVLKPVQHAIRHQGEAMRRHVKQSQQQNNINTSFDQRVASAIPMIGDPLQGPLIKQVVAQARANSKGNDAAAIQSALKALGAMGINPRGNQQRQRQGQRVNTLDNYLPLRNIDNAMNPGKK